jgi:hypothetical protein
MSATTSWSALTPARSVPLASDQRTEVSALRLKMRGLLRWIVTGMLAALLPKCLACLVGYLAVLSGLTRAAPELCGDGSAGALDALTYTLVALALAAGIGAAFRLTVKNRPQLSGSGTAKR